MKPAAIVAEGPDDLAALRALLRDAEATVRGTFHDANRNPMQVTIGESTMLVWKAGGKNRELTERTIDAAKGTASYRPEIVVVCFDPDTDPEVSEFSFFSEQFEEVRGDRAGPLAIDSATGWPTFVVDGRTVSVVPAPWRLNGAPAFAGLPEEHNLERVMISGLLEALPDDARSMWAAKATAELIALVSDHGWKRAFRIWSAAVVPASEAAVDKLLQKKDVQDGCFSSLKKAKAWQRILAVLGA